MNAQKAAETTVAALKEIKAMRAALEANAATAPKLNKATATRAADASVQLRSAITEWFNFYNGYDPLFTWWMAMPFKQIDAALQDYALFLRDKVAAADAQVPATPASVPPFSRRRRQKYASVPDLAEIIALPQDELRDIVGRFNAGRPGGGRGGRGGRGGGAADPAAPAPAAPDNTFYVAWLAALKSLDFDRLSRNAQVDYLYIKWTAETEIKRAGDGRFRRARRARPTRRTSRDVRAAAPASFRTSTTT